MVAAKVFVLVAAIVSIVAFAIIIIAVAAPVWNNTSTEVTVSRVIRQTYYTGLWSSCYKEEVKDEDTFSCTDISDDDALRSVRAMILLGAITCAGVVVCIFLKCCLFKDNKIVTLVSIVLCICTIVFLIIGVIVFAEEVSTDVDDLHAGFALSIVAAGLVVGVTVILTCLFCTNDKVLSM